MKKEVLLYEKKEKKSVRCRVCSHQCSIPEGDFGICGVRQNIGGELYLLVYGNPVALNVDPIEKKPLYHFLPGSKSFSLATIGCNFRCGFCQNWRISQAKAQEPGARGTDEIRPQEIVRRSLEEGCASISYTYTEPTIFFEYAYDIAKVATSKGLSNIFVTNGYMTKECLEMMRPFLDAANVDLKFFKEESYRKICGARLEPVLNSIRNLHAMGVWVEVTTLIIPGVNDSEQELKGIATFLAGIDTNIPWHVSRFHPDYVFTGYDVTPEPVLKKAVEIGARAGLHFVYAGNVLGWGSETRCASCAKPVIRRNGFTVSENLVNNGKCPYCKAMVAGIFV
jgi:pyruvate formate lyase activating enzyme